MRSWLLILTAATLNLRFLLAAPVFERRRTGISPQGAARDKSLLAGNNVLPFIGGLAVGGTVGYFVGARQSRRKINNRQRQTSRNSASNRPTTAGIERIKKKELETRIREYLQSDHYGLDWAYECRTLRVRTDSHKKSYTSIFVFLAGILIVCMCERESVCVCHLRF